MDAGDQMPAIAEGWHQPGNGALFFARDTLIGTPAWRSQPGRDGGDNRTVWLLPDSTTRQRIEVRSPLGADALRVAQVRVVEFFNDWRIGRRQRRGCIPLRQGWGHRKRLPENSSPQLA
jgi:hypothetical protein